MRVAYFPDFSGFLKLYLVTGFKKCVKLTFSIFKENSHYAEIGLNMTFLDLKSILLNCSPNLFIKFFWDCMWWQAWKSGGKRLFWFFKENSYHACFGFLMKTNVLRKIGEIGHFIKTQVKISLSKNKYLSVSVNFLC